MKRSGLDQNKNLWHPSIALDIVFSFSSVPGGHTFNTRRLGALAALALTFVLAACSTDNDLAATPELAPQFGTANDDFGIDTAVTSTGSVAVLSQEDSYYYNEDYGVDTSRTDLLRKLYDNTGTLAWETTLISNDCAYRDSNGYYCYAPVAKKLVADKKGNTYALVAHLYTSEYEPVYINHYLYKLGSPTRVRIGCSDE